MATVADASGNSPVGYGTDPAYKKLLEGSFTGTGQSGSLYLYGDFDLSLSGWGSATVLLQKSYDAGTNWKTIETYTADAQPSGVQKNKDGALFRLNCTVHGSGTIVYRLGN